MQQSNKRIIQQSNNKKFHPSTHPVDFQSRPKHRSPLCIISIQSTRKRPIVTLGLTSRRANHLRMKCKRLLRRKIVVASTDNLVPCQTTKANGTFTCHSARVIARVGSLVICSPNYTVKNNIVLGGRLGVWMDG